MLDPNGEVFDPALAPKFELHQDILGPCDATDSLLSQSASKAPCISALCGFTGIEDVMYMPCRCTDQHSNLDEILHHLTVMTLKE